MEIWTLRTFGKNPMFFVLVISLLILQKYWIFMWVFYVRWSYESADARYFLNFQHMPSKRKAYSRFAVGQFMKAKKSLQEELAKEKASLSTEVKTLQRKVERLDSKVFIT